MVERSLTRLPRGPVSAQAAREAAEKQIVGYTFPVLESDLRYYDNALPNNTEVCFRRRGDVTVGDEWKKGSFLAEGHVLVTFGGSQRVVRNFRNEVAQAKARR